jgi:hypothetical protein
MRAPISVAVVLAFGVLTGCGADSGASGSGGPASGGPASGGPTSGSPASGGPKGTDTVAVGKDFTLAPGQSAKLAKDDLTVTFVKVTGDSRCPKGVSCVWAGDATVTVSSGGTTTYDLHTGRASAQTVKISGHDVKLVGLTPQLQAGSTITPGDYRATLRIE